MTAQLPRTQDRQWLGPGAREVLEAFERAAAQSGVVVLDLSHLTFLDRAAALLVVRLDLRVRAAGGRLIVVQGAASLHRCLDPIALVGQLEVLNEPP
jgi:STAS domain